MIKYFSDILSKFTPGQRVFVISLLLLALVTVTLGPFLIKSFRPDNKELRLRLDQIQNDNVSLGQKNYTLNQELINNQQECTNRIVTREKEILSQLDDLEKKFNNQTTPTSIDSFTRDTSVSIVPLMVSPTQTNGSKAKTLLTDIKKVKDNIKKHIVTN